jgi:GTP cyclohydrolase I
MKKKEIDRQKIETAFTMILEAIGEDPQREGVKNTPKRIAKMYEEIFYGMDMDPQELLQVSFND